MLSEHRCVFAHGAGTNGKSTLLNTINRIFGDYATVADVGTFLAHNHERHPTDIAKLHGARLVVAQETERGRRWDEVKIKAMTGGDKMTARFMRQDFFDFTPIFKLFITGNNKPHLDNVDEAIRRRLMIVPFTVQNPAGRARPPTARQAHDRSARYPALVHRRLPGLAARRPATARHRHRSHRRLFRRSRHHSPMARRMHPRRRTLRLHQIRHPPRLMETMVR